jgi:hypothetical protein
MEGAKRGKWEPSDTKTATVRSLVTLAGATAARYIDMEALRSVPEGIWGHILCHLSPPAQAYVTGTLDPILWPTQTWNYRDVTLVFRPGQVRTTNHGNALDDYGAISERDHGSYHDRFTESVYKGSVYSGTRSVHDPVGFGRTITFPMYVSLEYGEMRHAYERRWKRDGRVERRVLVHKYAGNRIMQESDNGEEPHADIRVKKCMQ